MSTIDFNLESDVSTTNTPSKRKQCELRRAFHFSYDEVPDLPEEEWELVESRKVVDTYYDDCTSPSNSLFIQDFRVKERVITDNASEPSSWIVSRIYSIDGELAITNVKKDTMKERDEYLLENNITGELDLEEVATFTIYQDVYVNKNNKGIECIIANAVMPDKTVKNYGHLKSAKRRDIDKYKEILKLTAGVHPIIELLSKNRSDLFECLAVPHRDAMSSTRKDIEDGDYPRFFLDGKFDDGITDEEIRKFYQ